MEDEFKPQLEAPNSKVAAAFKAIAVVGVIILVVISLGLCLLPQSVYAMIAIYVIVVGLYGLIGLPCLLFLLIVCLLKLKAVIPTFKSLSVLTKICFVLFWIPLSFLLFSYGSSVLSMKGYDIERASGPVQKYKRVVKYLYKYKKENGVYPSDLNSLDIKLTSPAGYTTYDEGKNFKLQTSMWWPGGKKNMEGYVYCSSGKYFGCHRDRYYSKKLGDWFGNRNQLGIGAELCSPDAKMLVEDDKFIIKTDDGTVIESFDIKQIIKNNSGTYIHAISKRNTWDNPEEKYYNVSHIIKLSKTDRFKWMNTVVNRVHETMTPPDPIDCKLYLENGSPYRYCGEEYNEKVKSKGQGKHWDWEHFSYPNVCMEGKKVADVPKEGKNDNTKVETSKPKRAQGLYLGREYWCLKDGIKAHKVEKFLVPSDVDCWAGAKLECESRGYSLPSSEDPHDFPSVAKYCRDDVAYGACWAADPNGYGGHCVTAGGELHCGGNERSNTGYNVVCMKK